MPSASRGRSLWIPLFPRAPLIRFGGEVCLPRLRGRGAGRDRWAGSWMATPLAIGWGGRDRRLTAIAGDAAHFPNGDLHAFGRLCHGQIGIARTRASARRFEGRRILFESGPRAFTTSRSRKTKRGPSALLFPTLALVTVASPALSWVGRRLAQATNRIHRGREMGLTRPSAGELAYRILAIDRAPGPNRHGWTLSIDTDALSVSAARRPLPPLRRAGPGHTSGVRPKEQGLSAHD